MLTLSEIEKKKDELATTFKESIKTELWPHYGDTNFEALKEAYLSGFYACMALMLDREKAMKYHMDYVLASGGVLLESEVNDLKQIIEKLK